MRTGWASGLTMGCLAALSVKHAEAWNPPDPATLEAEFLVREREQGRPILLARAQTPTKSKGGKVASQADSLWLRLFWRDGRIAEARYQQTQPFDPNAFMPLASQFGGGGTWHELADPTPQSDEVKAYPGLIQQWQLEGFGGVAGWAGAGVHHERFFLIFRQQPVTRLAAPGESLALRSDMGSCMDTLTQWLKISCPSGWPGIPTLSTCYSPFENPRRIVAKMPLGKNGAKQGQPHWVVLWQEGEGLHDVIQAMQTLPAGEEASYAEDLSRILGGEGMSFLSQAAHANPCLFNQPSWAIARLKIGQVPAKQYHGYLGPQGEAVDWLPALQYATPACSLSVDIAKGGAYRLKAYLRNP
jgi:hypothetical protein